MKYGIALPTHAWYLDVILDKKWILLYLLQWKMHYRFFLYFYRLNKGEGGIDPLNRGEGGMDLQDLPLEWKSNSISWESYSISLDCTAHLENNLVLPFQSVAINIMLTIKKQTAVRVEINHFRALLYI